MTGAEAIINYSLDIFRRANIKWNNYVLSILVQTGSIIGYFISTFLISRIKRKVQYISTAALMAISQIILESEMDQATNAKGVVGSSFTKQHQDAHRSSSSMSNRSNFDVSVYLNLLMQNMRAYYTRVQLTIFFTGIPAG